MQSTGEETSPPLSKSDLLSDRDWTKLIRDIHHGQVIPVVGPELVTVVPPESGTPISLNRFLAPGLAGRLGIDLDSVVEGSLKNVNEVVSAHLLGGGRRKDVYDEIREMLDDLDEQPSDPLRALSRIGGFDFFVTSTYDHQLAKALASERVNFDPKENLVRFHPTDPIDIEEPLAGTCLFHILGDYNTYPDFALWEEDYMEFVCGLIENRDTLERLFRLFKKRYFLLLGAPASDWIVRFLLRATRQERLSDRSDSSSGEYLMDRFEIMEPPLVFFFDKMIRATRVVNGDPLAFVTELSRRWDERHGQAESEQVFLDRIPEAMPKDSVFISYAKEDFASAVKIAKALDGAGIPVWLDKGRLNAGGNYETGLQAAVRVHSSFFVSLISDTTEADTERNRYVHKERDWAADRHMDGYVYYIPVSIREKGLGPPHAEPECFSKIHFHDLPQGEPNRPFLQLVRSYLDMLRTSGRPRD